MKIKVLLIFLFILLAFYASAQELVKSKKKVVSPQFTIQIEDSLYILPNSIMVKKKERVFLPKSDFIFEFSTYTIRFNSSSIKQGDTLEITYLCLNLPVKGSLRLFPTSEDTTYLVKKNVSGEYFDKPPQETAEALRKNGNISRGFSIGNKQDLGINSSLNLQLQGTLNDIEVNASISDNNLPIQPDGTSAKIQEFDKIFIRLSKNQNSLSAGDLSLQSSNHQKYLRYKRNAQGIQIESKQGSTIIANDKMRYEVFATAAKGKFNRQTIQSIDGVLGPYRLLGADNEQYIVVLAGSENVFLDGKKLTRGLDGDYIIDYNTAELRFMPKVSISIHSRIIVEFEYSDKKFVRSLWGGNIDWENKTTRFSAGIISEGDMKNQPLQQSLSSNDKTRLFNSGENFPIFSSGIDSNSFVNDRVMYRMTDTLGYDSVLVFSTDSNLALYTATFSFVGKGLGNYRQAGYNINGRTYEWIAPLNGQKQGDYEPVSILFAPEQKKMLYFHFTQNCGKFFKIIGDYAFSNNDKNTFSPFGNGNNKGIAANIMILGQFPASDSNKSKKEITFYNQFIESSFTPFDRFESIEFDRDWNINLLKPKGDQWRRGIKFKRSRDINHGDMQIEQLQIKGGYQAMQIQSQQTHHSKAWEIKQSILGTIGSFKEYKFLTAQNVLHISKRIRKVNFGILESGEYNKTDKAQILLNGSGFFIQGETYISFGDSSKNNFKLFQRARYDEKGVSENFQFYSRIYESGLQTLFFKPIADRLKAEILIRQTQYEKTLLLKDEKTTQARLEYVDSYWNKVISANLFAELSNGSEAKKEYSYIEVLPGNGTHAWIDFNGNGIKELSEFTPALYNDQANYIKMILPGNEYIKTFLQSINSTIIFDGGKVIGNSIRKNVLKKIYNRANSQIYSSISDGQRRFQSLFSDDSSLISSSRLLRNTLIINKNGETLNWTWDFQKQHQNYYSVNGSEMRDKTKHEFKIHWNISRNWLIEPQFSQAKQKLFAPWAANTSYSMQESSTKVALTYQRESKFRWSIGGEYASKENETDQSNANSKKIFSEIRISKAGQMTIGIRYSLNAIHFSGEENGAASYIMLEGLKPGTNHLWNISLQMLVMNNVQLSLIYDGRAPYGSETIHTGSIQVRANL